MHPGARRPPLPRPGREGRVRLWDRCEPRGVAEGRRRVQGLGATGRLEWKAEPEAAVGGPQVRRVHSQERRQGFSGPRQWRPPHRHDQDPILQPARWHDHPQRRDEEVRLYLETGSRGPGVRRKGWVLTGAAVLVALAATGGGVVLSRGGQATATAQAASANTATVQKGKLSAAVSQDGTLTYRARPDGAPFSAINHARGTYTELPGVGDKVDCGGVLYRVDDRPVLLLCGTVPVYRAIHVGDAGQDVRQLNRSLHVRGAGGAFTTKTQSALEALQRRRGVHVTGALALGDAVFLPDAVRIAKVAGELGGVAQPG